MRPFIVLVYILSGTRNAASAWSTAPGMKRQACLSLPRSTNTQQCGFSSISTAHFSLATPEASSSASTNNERIRIPMMNNNTSSVPYFVSASSLPRKAMDAEREMGRLLEGGQVMDFSAVKASSQVEDALKQARDKYLQHSAISTHDDGAAAKQLQSSSLSLFGSGILGIDQNVVDEVGHDLGVFATPQQVQGCARFLRSQAPSDMFVKKKEEAVQQEYSADQVAQYRSLLRQAYEEAGEVTGAFAKTFYMGTMLMPLAAREAIWAIYVWCRRTDEIVDAPRTQQNVNGNGSEQDLMLMDLSAWELRLEDLWTYGAVVDVYDLCLLDVRIRYPTLDLTPFLDMIRGMLMDLPGLGQDRYETFDELHLYCYRVAGTVGLMSLPIFGCAANFNEDLAREPALSLGVAFQLTNILRDVGEDAVQRGRVYLPQQDLKQFGVTEEQIFAQKLDQNFQELMKFEIARARMYYERARRGVFMLAPESRLPVQSSIDAYGRILDKIEANKYDSLTKRAYVDKWEKLSILPFSWYRTLDISQSLPLPGDKLVLLNKV